jgi:hypothetical protein
MCLRPGFKLKRLFEGTSKDEALERELLETVWAAQLYGFADGAGARGACFVQPTLPPLEKQALRLLTKALPAGKRAAAAALKELLEAGKLADCVRLKLERHLAGTCWVCGGKHFAAKCGKATSSNGLRRRSYPSGAAKRRSGDGGGTKGSAYKSGQRKRRSGAGGGTKGKSKPGQQKRNAGTGGGTKGRSKSGSRKRKKRKLLKKAMKAMKAMKAR